MFILCDKCKNHYDDSHQSEECNGVGKYGHDSIASRPIDDHIGYTIAARRDASERTRHTAQERPVTASAGLDG